MYLLSSRVLVMSINMPNLGFSEGGRAIISGMVGNEESLTPHESKERSSPVLGWEGGVTVGSFFLAEVELEVGGGWVDSGT